MEMWQLALLILLALGMGFFIGVLCEIFHKQLKKKLDFRIGRIIYEDEDD